MKKSGRRREDVILLNDLAPRKEVKGGTGKRVFGESVAGGEAPPRPETEKKERSGPQKVEPAARRKRWR